MSHVSLLVALSRLGWQTESLSCCLKPAEPRQCCADGLLFTAVFSGGSLFGLDAVSNIDERWRFLWPKLVTDLTHNQKKTS